MIWPILRGSGRNPGKNFVVFFVQTNFEINWPLLCIANCSVFNLEFSPTGFVLHFRYIQVNECQLFVEVVIVRSWSKGWCCFLVLFRKHYSSCFISDTKVSEFSGGFSIFLKYKLKTIFNEFEHNFKFSGKIKKYPG